MGFIHRRTSKQTGRVKTLLGLALTRLAVARRPRLARKSISRGDVGQLLALGHLDRALHRAEQVIEEDNMLEAFNIIELYCNRLIEHAKQLDKPDECGEDIREAAAGIMFAAGWCGDLPELLFARTILADKFGGDFAMMAKEGTGVVDPMLVWKLAGNKRNMELKKKVVKEIASENNIQVDFSDFPEMVEHNGSDKVPHQSNQEAILGSRNRR
ncbi:IST1-like protein [Panicum miliaceum]|uniref:IST1-like protein n=1 Tax=Panicum miliaceum TaxID=4540 RepID=A0A3L6SC66_PANMI|nr:IST1-like protein [Panicum miliaceum]